MNEKVFRSIKLAGSLVVAAMFGFGLSVLCTAPAAQTRKAAQPTTQGAAHQMPRLADGKPNFTGT